MLPGGKPTQAVYEYRQLQDTIEMASKASKENPSVTAEHMIIHRTRTTKPDVIKEAN